MGGWGGRSYGTLLGAMALLGCQPGSQAPGQSGEPSSTSPPASASTTSTIVASPEQARSGNRTQPSFNKAKRSMRAIYAGHEQTFYCGCSYTGSEVDQASCGYESKGNRKRAQRVEWEHVVPAHAFGQSFAAWRDGHPDCVRKDKTFKGRNCARKVAVDFRHMEADMYNLVPAIGEVNWLRSNFSFAELDGEPRELGACDFEIAGRKVEPRPAIRGDIARTYMYMDAAYPGRGILSDKNRKLFEAWAAADPVDAWECQRARLIEKVQGNRNGVVASACEDAGL